MFIRIIRLSLPAALSAATLLGAAVPSYAQAKPIVTCDASVAAPMAGPLGIELSLVMLPNGSLEGHGTQVIEATGGWIEFDLSSYVFLGDMLCVAGPVTASFDAPFPVGATVVISMYDNGSGKKSPPDLMAGTVGPPGLDIQDVLDLIGPPPPAAFQPLTGGNLTIH